MARAPDDTRAARLDVLNPPATLRVVAGVLQDSEGRVLIAERPAGKAMAGWWEFPGGKIASGETARAALARELDEELGIELEDAAPMMELSHDYPERRIELSVWRVGAWRGTPGPREGQALQWLHPRDLASVRLLPADAPIVAQLF